MFQKNFGIFGTILDFNFQGDILRRHFKDITDIFVEFASFKIPSDKRCNHSRLYSVYF